MIFRHFSNLCRGPMWNRHDYPTDLQEALHMAGWVFWSGSIVPVREQNHHSVLQQPFGFTCRHQSFTSVIFYEKDNCKRGGISWTCKDDYLQRWRCRKWSVLRWRSLQTEPPRSAGALAGRYSYRTQNLERPPQTAGCYTPTQEGMKATWKDRHFH